MGYELSEDQKIVLRIIKKIKGFTMESPADKGVADPSYKIYLSKCVSLWELDVELTDTLNLEYLTAEELRQRLIEIEEEVDRVI